MAFFNSICVFSNWRRGMWSKFLRVNQRASISERVNVSSHCLAHCDRTIRIMVYKPWISPRRRVKQGSKISRNLKKYLLIEKKTTEIRKIPGMQHVHFDRFHTNVYTCMNISCDCNTTIEQSIILSFFKLSLYL